MLWLCSYLYFQSLITKMKILETARQRKMRGPRKEKRPIYNIYKKNLIREIQKNPPCEDMLGKV